MYLLRTLLCVYTMDRFNVGMISWAGWVDRGLTEYQPSTFKIHTQQEFM